MAITLRLSDQIHPVSGAKKNIEIIGIQHSEFKHYWNMFLETYPFHNFDYTFQSLEYRSMLLGQRAENRSFILKDKQNRPLSICPLFIISDKNGQKKGAFGHSKPAPTPLFYPHLSEKQRRSLEDIVFKHGTENLKQHDAASWEFEADILSVGTELIEDQFPARHGALDISIHQHIVDLTQNEQNIWQQLRRRAHAEINRGLDIYDFKVYDQDNYCNEIGEKHMELHHKTAGKITRPIATFLKTYDWIVSGHAFMVEQRYQNQTVNMTLVELGKRMATGASTADDPNFTPPAPLMHSMMWTIMMECKKRGICYFNAGETNFRDTPYQQLSQKEKNIIYFKRGFGQLSYPLKKWIWFKDAQAELQHLQKCLKNYQAHIMTNTHNPQTFKAIRIA